MIEFLSVAGIAALMAAPLVILAVIPDHILFGCPEDCPCRNR